MPESKIADRYMLSDELGSGGMGTVYRGIDSLTQKTVAIKQLKSQIAQPEIIERFKREGEALRELNHPNIVKMLDTVEESGNHFLVMEYVSGGDLRNVIEQHGKLDYRRCVDMAIDLADALTRAHRLNIIHRDLKPANVLIADDGTLRLTDFGVAHIGSKARVTNTDAIVGTIDYLPPEVFGNAPFDARSDIWAFGVMLFEMLTGQRPFKGESMVSTITSILTAPLPNIEALSPETPTALVDLVYRMLERDPGARISSVRHVGAALEDIHKDRQSTPSPPRFETPATDYQYRPKHNLPAQVTPFVGREHELAELDKLLADASLRLITVIAPGGMGKTRLALEAGQRAVPQFEDGVCFVELAPLSDPNNIVSSIADAAGYQFQVDGREQKQQLLDYLQQKSMLLVLDNFEHLLDGAGLVTDILKSAPAVQILATSRQRLGQSGETLFHLSGMDFPAWETPDDALEYAAIKLFMNSAKRAKPDFELTSDSLDAVARVCILVEGMPLGIVLAASWLAMLSPQEIADEIAQSLDFLETHETDLPERQRSIRAVMNYSWKQMSADEQQVFMKLSVFRGGFTREAAQEIASANLPLLMSLVRKSMIRRDAESGRYETHELLRQHGEAKLKAAGEFNKTRNKHGEYYLMFIQNAEPEFFSANQLVVLRKLESEYDNIRASLNWFVQSDQDVIVLKICGLMWWFWYLRLYVIEGYQWLKPALDKSPEPTIDRAKGLFCAGVFALFIDRNAEAIPMLKESVDLYGELGDKAGMVGPLEFLRLYNKPVPDYDQYRLLLHECIEFCRKTGDQWNLAFALLGVGLSYLDQGNFTMARPPIEASVVEGKKIGERAVLSLAMEGLGVIELNAGDNETARKLYEEVLLMRRELEDKWLMGWAYRNLGNVARQQNDMVWLRKLLIEEMDLFRETGNKRFFAESLRYLGDFEALQGNNSEAKRRYNDSLKIRYELNDQQNIADLLDILAHLPS